MRRRAASVLLVAAYSVLAPAGAFAAFDVTDDFDVASAVGPQPPSVALNASGASLTAYVANGALLVRERSAGGAVGEPQVLRATGGDQPNAALGPGGEALVGVHTSAGPMVFSRPAGGTFGPGQVVGGPRAAIDSLEMDDAGNAAVVLREFIGTDRTRMLLSLRPAGGVFEPVTALSRSDAVAQLAFDGTGALAVAVVDQTPSILESGRRLAIRSGTFAAGAGKALTLARTRGRTRIESAQPAIDAKGRVRVVYDVVNDSERAPFRSVRLATVARDGARSTTRVLAGGGAYGSQIVSVGDRTAVAWTSISTTRAGISATLCSGSARCERPQQISAPERGFNLNSGRSRPVRGATEARSGGPQVRLSRRGDVGVVWVSAPDFGPRTVLAAVRVRGAAGSDGPDPVSPLGADATPGPLAWTTGGALLVSIRSGTTLSLAQRTGLPVVRRPTDRTAPKVTLTRPTRADLDAGMLTSRVSCSEACAFVSRAVIIVGNDIAKPDNEVPMLAGPGRPATVSLPLQRTQRPKLAAGIRPVRARLRVSVVDRLGNATTGQTEICIPRRRGC